MSIFTIVFSLVILIVVFVYFINVYNNLIAMRNNINKAFSNIDVLLKQRKDELTKLFESVKGYMKYEKDVLVQITEARSAYSKAKTITEKTQADNMITETIKSLFAVVENYPELKANESFIHFQNRITDIENTISDRREFFNDTVNNYNIRIKVIPEVLIAKIMGYKPMVMFKAPNERKDVIIKFN